MQGIAFAGHCLEGAGLLGGLSLPLQTGRKNAMNKVIPKLSRKSAWIFSLVLLAWVSLIPGETVAAKSVREKNRFVITVGIYNYAEITLRELREAERQAATFFAKARIRIAWLEYSQQDLTVPSPSRDPAADLYVRILHASKTKPARRTSGFDVMGESIIPSVTEGPLPGHIANIFYDRLKGLSRAWGQFSGNVLGEAIAHELGHLLLGSQHSRRGIMKARWNFRDQLLINRCQMGFSREQATALQRAVRSLQNNRSLTITAQR